MAERPAPSDCGKEACPGEPKSVPHTSDKIGTQVSLFNTQLSGGECDAQAYQVVSGTFVVFDGFIRECPALERIYASIATING